MVQDRDLRSPSHFHRPLPHTANPPTHTFNTPSHFHTFSISRVSDQSGVSLLYIMLEIHHSGQSATLDKKLLSAINSVHLHTLVHSVLLKHTPAPVSSSFPDVIHFRDFRLVSVSSTLPTHSSADLLIVMLFCNVKTGLKLLTS